MTVWAAWSDGTAHAFEARRLSVTRTRCGLRVLPQAFERPALRRCRECSREEATRANDATTQTTQTKRQEH